MTIALEFFLKYDYKLKFETWLKSTQITYSGHKVAIFVTPNPRNLLGLMAQWIKELHCMQEVCSSSSVQVQAPVVARISNS